MIKECIVKKKCSNDGRVFSTKEVGELVRCKDCKYQHKCDDGFCWCNKAVVDMSDYEDSCVIADDDNYCSFGQRKEQEYA